MGRDKEAVVHEVGVPTSERLKRSFRKLDSLSLNETSGLRETKCSHRNQEAGKPGFNPTTTLGLQASTVSVMLAGSTLWRSAHACRLGGL